MAVIAFRSIVASPDNTSSDGRMPQRQLLFMESLYLYRHSEDYGPAPQVVHIVSPEWPVWWGHPIAPTFTIALGTYTDCRTIAYFSNRAQAPHW